MMPSSPKVIGVGDNTVDQYLHLRQMFPGGNAVNVPVLAHRYGAQASYLGWLGDDQYGQLILKALQTEGVDISHCRVVAGGVNAHCEVSLVNGDRVFGKSDAGVTRQIALNEDDFHFIQQHDLVHTSIYSHISRELPRLFQCTEQLSFDFSQSWQRSTLAELLPFTHVAFLSYPDQTYDNAVELLRWVNAQGPRLVVVTRGKDGALAYDGVRLYQQSIVDANVVDTLGAGDASIARILVELAMEKPIAQAMELAAISAAETCGYYGAFGHGVDL